jgi:phage terminase large subunit-like protein
VPFDSGKADRACRFFSRYLRHTKGRFGGAPFVLQPWQEDLIIRPLFGTLKEDGTRQYSTALIEIPRKNGKSEISAGIALKCLTADGEYGAEVYGAALDREQAGAVYEVAQQMVYLSPHLNARCRVTPSRRNIAVPKTNGKYRVVSADAGRQHGLNPSCVVFDEIHTQRNRRLWDVMNMGSDTRTQALMVGITTNGVPDEAPLWWDLHEYARQVREGIFQDESLLSVHFGADAGDDFEDPKVWKKANPALGSFLSLEKFKVAFERAKRITSEWNEFLRYRLNVTTNTADRWLKAGDWDACGRKVDWKALRGQPCYCGLDLSTRRDITALVQLFPLSNGEVFVKPHFWLPEANIPQRLRQWVPDFITPTPGSVVDYDFVLQRIAEIREAGPIELLQFDEWNASQIETELQKSGLKVATCRFGMRSMNGPTKEAENKISSRSLVHDGNPVLRWMADCVTLRQDANGNVMPVKPDRLKSEKRIDGVAAMLMGLDPILRMKPTSSIYDDPEFVAAMLAT